MAWLGTAIGLVIVGFAIAACFDACGRRRVNVSDEEDASFVRASMGMPQAEGADRPIAADIAVEPISMLVMFNRLHTAERLQEALNRRPGQFSRVDLDRDGEPDLLTVVKRDTQNGHTFEIRARPQSGEYVVAAVRFTRARTAERVQDALNSARMLYVHTDLDKDSAADPLNIVEKKAAAGQVFEIRARPQNSEFVVATLMFDPEWGFLGKYDGAIGGAASTLGRPVPAAPQSGAAAPVVAPTVASGAAASATSDIDGICKPDDHCPRDADRDDGDDGDVCQ